jgi:hypothetical protein
MRSYKDLATMGGDVAGRGPDERRTVFVVVRQILVDGRFERGHALEGGRDPVRWTSFERRKTDSSANDQASGVRREPWSMSDAAGGYSRRPAPWPVTCSVTYGLGEWRPRSRTLGPAPKKSGIDSCAISAYGSHR